MMYKVGELLGGALKNLLGKSLDSTVILYCSNLECKEPVTGDRVLYDSFHSKIYHSEECYVLMAAHHAANFSAEVHMGKLGHISRTEALLYLRVGDISQPPRIEERVQSL